MGLGNGGACRRLGGPAARAGHGCRRIRKRCWKMDWKKYLARMSQNENVHVLLLFLAGMAVLTVLARVADSFMVPQVSVGKAVEMRLQYPMEIEGRIRAKGEQAMYCRENLRVAQVLVQKGDSVKKGDVLFTESFHS